jgi:hypothetical protein
MDNVQIAGNEFAGINVNADADSNASGKNRTWLTTAEKHIKYQKTWGDPAPTKAFQKMSHDDLLAIFKEQEERKQSNVQIAWSILGCADNIVPKLRKTVGLEPLNARLRKKKCDTFCEITDIDKQIDVLTELRNKKLAEQNNELRKEREELREKLEIINRMIGD